MNHEIIIDSFAGGGMTDPSADGMVRCCDCARQTRADKGGRMRLVCTAVKSRPALISEKWRRCNEYVARKTK